MKRRKEEANSKTLVTNTQTTSYMQTQ